MRSKRYILSLFLLLLLGSYGCSDGFLRVDVYVDGKGDDSGDPVADGSDSDDGSTSTGSNGTDGSDGAGNLGPLECEAGESFCLGACLDVLSNPDHCGGCDIVCESGTCESGVCAPGDEMGDDMGDDGTSDEDGPAGDGTGDDAPPMEDPPEAPVGTPPEVAGVWEQTNAARASGADCGAYGDYAPTASLELDTELNEAAQAHADDMSANNFFSHTGSDGSSFVVRIQRTAFSGQPIGENIAAGQQSPAQAVSGWVDSDGHCRNLMNPDATKIGIGYATGGPYGTLWVQVFGR